MAKSRERAHRHSKEKREITLQDVQDLETKYEVEERWTPESEEWRQAAKLVQMHQYQTALDHLEALVVARIFELTKMNMSHTTGA